MISNGEPIGLFVRFPQVLVYEKDGRCVFFEIPNDLDTLQDEKFDVLSGSVQGYDAQNIQFWNTADYNYLRYPTNLELLNYENNKSI